MITILSTGSRGDTQPYLALGMALKNAGISVRIAAFENYADFVKGYGLEFHPIRGDVSRVASGEGAAHARQADNPLKLMLSFNKLKKLVGDLQQDFFSACVGSDAIVYHPGAPIGYFAGLHFNIPSILATPFPMAPTRTYPALIFYNSLRLGRTYNLATHKIFEQIMWSASSSAVKQFWLRKFGHAPQNFGCPFSRQITQPLPTIISCSDHVFPTPGDWPEHIHNTGFWFLDDLAGWEPPSDLLDFLENGTPPVYVGFGSMGDPLLAAQTTELVVAALKLSGQRGVLATGWNGMSGGNVMDEHVFILDHAPHSWLFPRMAAVVHHGGAGTTAAGLRAGVPNIIIPSSNDQFAWGRRVYELGLGSNPIPRKELTAEKLAEAIHRVLTKDFRAAAKGLGVKLQQENGAERAAIVIIKTLEYSKGE